MFYLLNYFASIRQAMTNLFERYKSYVVDIDIIYKMGHQKKIEMPQFEKIILHGSSGELLGERKQLLRCALEWELLALQRPIATRARQNIATYSLRERTPMGVKTTLRGGRMFQFLTRLLFLYLPRMHEKKLNPSKKNGFVWTCVFDDIRSFLEIEYFFQFFETYPGIQCSIFFKTKKKENPLNFIYLSAFAFPIVLK